MQTFKFDQDTIERYTHGWCWELALELGKLLIPKGWVITIAECQTGAWHAFMTSPDKLAVDVTGIYPLKNFLDKWDVERHTSHTSLRRAKREFKSWDLGPALYGETPTAVARQIFTQLETQP